MLTSIFTFLLCSGEQELSGKLEQSVLMILVSLLVKCHGEYHCKDGIKVIMNDLH